MAWEAIDGVRFASAVEAAVAFATHNIISPVRDLYFTQLRKRGGWCARSYRDLGSDRRRAIRIGGQDGHRLFNT